MVRLHAETFVHGQFVGMRAFSDPSSKTMDEKLSDALEELFSGKLGHPPPTGPLLDAPPAALDGPPPTPTPEQPRRGPGRPPGPGKQRPDGQAPHTPHGGRPQ